MARVSKWGNSLAVRLPASLGFEEGQEVFVRRGEASEVVIVSEDEKARLERRKAAIEKLASLNWKLPPDYKFDRDELHER